MQQSDLQIKEEYDIIKKSKQDPAYFAPLYDKYYQKIFLFIFKRTQNKELTADLTSQVFLKALVNLKFYKFKGIPFSAWLFRVAANEANEFFRKSKNQRVISFEESGLTDLKDSINNNSELEEVENKLLAALNHLSLDEIHFIEFRFFEKRSFKEIGFILNITENNAKVKTYRILDKLRKVLTGKS